VNAGAAFASANNESWSRPSRATIISAPRGFPAAGAIRCHQDGILRHPPVWPPPVRAGSTGFPGSGSGL